MADATYPLANAMGSRAWSRDRFEKTPYLPQFLSSSTSPNPISSTINQLQNPLNLISTHLLTNPLPFPLPHSLSIYKHLTFHPKSTKPPFHHLSLKLPFFFNKHQQWQKLETKKLFFARENLGIGRGDSLKSCKHTKIFLRSISMITVYIA